MRYVCPRDPEKDKEVYALRPMTCPFQYQVFLNGPTVISMRLGETPTLFRNEDSGEMHGLIRVRQFTISEVTLSFALNSEDNSRAALSLQNIFLKHSLAGRNLPLLAVGSEDTKYIGTPEQWDEAQGL